LDFPEIQTTEGKLLAIGNINKHLSVLAELEFLKAKILYRTIYDDDDDDKNDAL
jgi:hypothetical protein